MYIDDNTTLFVRCSCVVRYYFHQDKNTIRMEANAEPLLIFCHMTKLDESKCAVKVFTVICAVLYNINSY